MELSAPRGFDLWRRLRHEPTAAFGLAILLIFIPLALCAPLISPYDPLFQNISASLTPPSADYWLGTDKLGRDLLSRMLYGARISLWVGTAVVLSAGMIGTLAGLLAGYLRGWVDEVLMRVTDIMLAFPYLLLAIAIVAALGTGLQNTTLAVGTMP